MQYVTCRLLHMTGAMYHSIKLGRGAVPGGPHHAYAYMYTKMVQAMMILAPSSHDPSSGGAAQLVERVLYHSTRRAVPERLWVQSLLPTTEVEPGFSTFGGMLVPVCKAGTSL
jgi:hypothetical protein